MAAALRAFALVAGLALVAYGLWTSPAPWLAPLIVGVCLVAGGLLLDDAR